MKKKIILLLLTQIQSFAQCLSGNCQNGFGKYDFGFAIYEGNFKSGKPNGQGTMDYGGGDKFVGNFSNGQEDGEGQLYKKNIPQAVTYINGKVKVREVQKSIGANAPTIEGCLQGDCYNGFGKIKFPSGNSYEGNFVYGVREGQGKFVFASGNILTATFKDNQPVQGSFFYFNEDTTFQGSFNSDGTPKSGDYKYPINKATVTIVNGVITNIDNPVAREADEKAEEQKTGKSCTKCGGKGMCQGTAYAQATESYYTVNTYRSNGSLYSSSDGNVGRKTTMVTPPPSRCSECNGTGKIFGGDQIIMSKRY
ncbi:hypothetical protein [Flavobacterium sp.]|uniref:hypothetical protein n=1 Tax=Flavobacterium sp. TaxID=239 RepID=UPI003265183D